MTSPHPTLFRHTASSDRKTPGGSFGLTPELAKKARARVKWFAFAMMIMSLIGVCFSLSYYALGALDQPRFFRQIFIFSLNSSISAVIWWIARTPRFKDQLVLNLGLVMEFLICLGAAIGTNMAMYQEHGDMAEMSWVTPIIILFPLIVPYPPRRMLVASLIAACTEPISVLYIWFTLNIEREPMHFEVMIYPVLAAGLAYYASRTIWGLNKEVARAQRLGSYQLEKRLGRGGMGEVWRASHQMLARPAAVKLIHPEALAEDVAKAQSVLERFEQEAQATAALLSPHTVDVYDFGRAEDGRFYYVMELLHGLNLQELIDRHGPQPTERVVHIVRQICHSLDEAHQEDLVHRDIKPANLFLCRYGQDVDFVKVLDFGLVKQSSTQSEAINLTRDGMAVGTPGFMAPEAALPTPPDGRADIYGVGCVTYWLLTGDMVFEADSPMQAVIQHARDIPARPSERSEIDIPSALDDLVLACLEKSPENRPQTARAVVDALTAIESERLWDERRMQRWWQTHMPVC